MVYLLQRFYDDGNSKSNVRTSTNGQTADEREKLDIYSFGGDIPYRVYARQRGILSWRNDRSKHSHF